MAAHVAGDRVKGQANVGDHVTYFDMANQDGTIWEVTSTEDENRDPKWGWSKGYGLKTADGRTSWSDLRQYGWTFADPELEH